MFRTIKARVCSRTVTAVLVVVVVVAAKPATGQTPPAPQAASLHGPVNDVTLDLAVRDRHNKPVYDLRPEEISVTDNGAPVKINRLHLVVGKQPDEPLITLLFDRPGTHDNKKGSEDAMFGQSPLAARRASKKLHDAAAKFMKGFPGAGFQFAVVDVWGRLQIQQQYTGDRKAISQAISAAVKPEVYGSRVTANAEEKRLIQLAKTGQDSSGSAAGTRQRALARTMFAAMQVSSHIAGDQHLSLSLACLLALVQAQQSVPGPKAIIYFTSITENGGDSQNWRSQDSHAKDAIRTIIGAANRTGANIYVVLPDEVEDTDQLAAIYSRPSLGMGSQIGSVDITRGASPIMGDSTGLAMAALATKQPSAIASQDNLNRLARQTGGDVLNAGGSMSGPIKELIQGLSTYYTASFGSPSEVQDGSFHTTAFKTTRRGLRMRARAGYLALPPSAGITQPPQPFELPLMAMLKRPERPLEIDYRAGVLRMGHREEGSVALLALEVPMSELQVREDASTHLNSAHVSVLATISDSTGTMIERFSEDIARRWAGGNAAGISPAFVSFERSFAAPPGKYVLETAIIDNNSSKASARRQKFEISAPQNVPELTDLLLVRGIEPTSNGGGEPDLLWRGEQRVQPNLYGQLPAGANKVQVFFLAHADPNSQDAATVTLEVLRDGVPLRGEPLTSTLKAGTGFEPVLKGFAISSGSDGEYEVRVTLTQGNKSAQAAGKFALTGGEAHNAGGGTGDAPLAVDPPGLADSAQTDDQPAPEVIDGELADARKNALDYGDVLPNLICQQTTSRLTDARHNGDWQLKDKLVEVLTYVNHQESRTVLRGEVNNQKRDEKTVSEIGMISTGEFGMALNNIFTPTSKAVFTWKQTGMLRGEPAEIFDYRIEQENSKFALTVPLASVKVGYHGRVYVDRATHGVQSITIITDEVPKKFPIRKAAIRIDYDYVAINDHDYMLPVSAQVVAERSGNLLERNDLEFSNFRKFGSDARIIGADPESEPQ
jgi:VWFA-related protein